MPTRITIVRHGETEWNKEGRMQGQANSPLSLKGVEQAKNVSRALVKRNFDTLISSDLGRAIQTTNIINEQLNKSVVIDSQLRERSFGVMEGNTSDELRQRYPDVYKSYMDHLSDYVIPEGESFEQFYNRIISSIDNISKEYCGNNILIIAHGCVLECILYKIFNLDLNKKRTFSINNTSINTFSINDDKWFLDEWGVVEHTL